MNQRILDFEKQFHKPKLPDLAPGDTVRVHQRIQEGEKTRIHQFEGIVIALKHGKGMSGSFTVRKTGAQGVGIETTFFWHAPTLFKVERIKSGNVRRAKLYYLRRLTAREGKKLTGAHVGEIWEEEAIKKVVEKEQAEQASESAKEGESEGEKEWTAAPHKPEESPAKTGEEEAKSVDKPTGAGAPS